MRDEEARQGDTLRTNKEIFRERNGVLGVIKIFSRQR